MTLKLFICSYYVPASYPLLSFGNGAAESPVIHLDDVHCSGAEEMLTHCEHSGLGIFSCREGIDEAGVVCTSTIIIMLHSKIIVSSKPNSTC